MKTLLAIIFLAATAVSTFGQTNSTVGIAWDYPASQLESNLVFVIRSSTAETSPAAAWPVILTVTNAPSSVTNGLATFTASLPIAPGKHYFVVLGKNLWGEGVPSNVASTPLVAAPPTALRVLVTVDVRINTP